MRTLLSLMLAGLVALTTAHAQGKGGDAGVLGTWTGPASCKHGDGETFTMTISRNDRGELVGTMDWALVSSDGRRGPGMPLTTLTVEGSSLTATAKRDQRTARLGATIEGDTISGTWTTTGSDDVWTFKGKRQPTR